jgi:hypothetical protein
MSNLQHCGVAELLLVVNSGDCLSKGNETTFREPRKSPADAFRLHVPWELRPELGAGIPSPDVVQPPSIFDLG